MILSLLTAIARSKTGSGKTLAYILPALELILRRKAENPRATGVFALILVPTKELSEQVTKVVNTFSAYCAKAIRTLNLAQKQSDEVQRSFLAEGPDIIIATPARVCTHLEDSALELATLNILVIDEADLVLSFGYENDIQKIATSLPNNVQSILMSATLSTEVDTLKDLFCKDPVTLELDETGEESNPISQFVVKSV
jgi:ATP-dependent RNA helicase DDX56/DBP9